eukprot:6203881-Pleurochrysis_carterae.AAC.1
MAAPTGPEVSTAAPAGPSGEVSELNISTGTAAFVEAGSTSEGARAGEGAGAAAVSGVDGVSWSGEGIGAGVRDVEGIGTAVDGAGGEASEGAAAAALVLAPERAAAGLAECGVRAWLSLNRTSTRLCIATSFTAESKSSPAQSRKGRVSCVALGHTLARRTAVPWSCASPCFRAWAMHHTAATISQACRAIHAQHRLTSTQTSRKKTRYSTSCKMRVRRARLHST